MRSGLARMCGYGLAVFTMLMAFHGNALAGDLSPVPEIDGASISAGLGALAAGILILRSRRSPK